MVRPTALVRWRKRRTRNAKVTHKRKKLKKFLKQTKEQQQPQQYKSDKGGNNWKAISLYAVRKLVSVTT